MNNTFRSLRFLSALLPFAFLSITASHAQLPTTPPDHIVILIEENYSYTYIMSTFASYAPHINALTTDTNAAIFTQAFAITHPSEPNYLQFFSGSNQGETTDGVPVGYPFTTPNLAAQLIAAGKTFVTYSEDLPSAGSDVVTYTAGGTNYARKHNPCANWMGTGANQFSGAVVNLPYTSFPAAANYATLPTVCYVVPNQTNDMHDGTPPSNITTGDTWYYSHLSSLLPWALANNTLFIIIFDEDDNLHSNNIPLIFYGPMVKGGTYAEHVDLYSVLRTLEALYGLGYAGSAASATTITDCWRHTITGINNVTNADYSFKVAPNPASGVINFNCNNPLNTQVTINITDQLGRSAGKYTMTGTEMQVNTASYAPGFYYYRALNDNNNIVGQGKFIINH